MGIKVVLLLTELSLKEPSRCNIVFIDNPHRTSAAIHDNRKLTPTVQQRVATHFNHTHLE